jgi:hypothetical protein
MWVKIGRLLLVSSILLGEEKVIDCPKIVTPEWEEQVFGVKQGVQNVTGSLHEMIDGLISEHFGADFFTRVEEAVKKQPAGEGAYTEYWPNGIKRAEIPFKNGKAHGHIHGFYDNGRDAFKGFFNEGVKQGIHITFFRTDVGDKRKRAHVLWFNEKGEFDRDQYTYHKTGSLFLATIYNNGKLNGALETWPVKGKQLLHAQYKDGVLQKDPPPPPAKRVRLGESAVVKSLNEINENCGKWAYEKYKLQLYNVGASMVDDVEEVTVDFIFIGKVTIDQAREMFIECNEKLTQMMNEHEKIRPYLRDYPFSRKRVQFSIGFRDKYGIHNTDGSTALVFIGKDDIIFYDSHAPYAKQYSDLYQEPYEEALKIVRRKR